MESFILILKNSFVRWLVATNGLPYEAVYTSIGVKFIRGYLTNVMSVGDVSIKRQIWKGILELFT